MNKNINLVEILKDCPEGTKFYSSGCGTVTFDHIEADADYPIMTKSGEYGTCSFTKEGKYYKNCDGECVIFPSKDQRDWNVWKKEQDQKNIWNQFEDGEYLWIKLKTSEDPWIFIYRKNIKGERVLGYGCLSNGFPGEDYYTDIMLEYQYIGTKNNMENIRRATVEQIQLFNEVFKDKYNKQWNPITKKFENIKTEMTISEIEKKLGLTSGSLRIKK